MGRSNSVVDVPVIDAALLDQLFGEAPQLYVGVVSGGQPHVTPELFATRAGRLWCLTAAVTRKAAVLAEDDRVAFLAAGAQGSVAGIGRAEVLDPLDLTNMSHPIDVARAAIGTARFALRNTAELAGAAIDALTGKLGRPLPPHRVIISIEPTALVAHGAGGLDVWGQWATGIPVTRSDITTTVDVDDTEASEALRALLDDGPAALGWFATDGHPLVLPAQWTRETSTARVPARLFVQCGGAEQSPAAVTRDKWTNYGPTGKQGVMLRGEGAVTAADEGVDAVVDVERLTYWDGVETFGVKVGG